MMAILAVNAGSHKGGRRASRVLDQFLPRVGVQAWAGYLSREGCEEMVAELRAQASRTTAVQVLWQHDHRHEVVATIGHTSRFNEMLTSIGKKPRNSKARTPPPFVRKSILMARAAGLWHDPGKAMDVFQKTIRGACRERHSIRHQTLGFYAFRRAVASPDFDGGRIACPQTGAWATGESLEHEITAAVILTHHAKAERNSDPEHFVLTEKRGFGTWASGSDQDAPLASIGRNWLDSARASIRRLRASREGRPTPGNHALAFYSTRLAMMLADHAVSSFEKTPSYNGRIDDTADPRDIYAKSKPFIPLADHLLDVGREAGHAAHALFMHAWPRLQRRPEGMMRTVPDRFRWQEHAEETIRQAGVGASDGFFGAIIAETGSGKTQAGFRIMSALSGGTPRFTLGLGFGALAIQSGAEYRHEIGLTTDEVAIVVGHRYKQALMEMERNLRAGEEVPDELLLGLESSTGMDDPYLPFVFEHGLGRIGKMLTTPIVVMTIDHIMAAMEADRGGFVAGASRAVTADLLIDEIDSFTPADLHAIARLVYLAGSFGRKVVVSSATMTPELGHMLFDAYRRGYAQFQSAMGVGRLFTGVFANSGLKAQMAMENAEGDSESLFLDAYDLVAGSVSRGLGGLQHRRRMTLLLPGEIHGEDDLFASIAQQAIELSKHHHTTMPGWHGHWFSTGFVRFNLIRHAQRFTRWLAEHAGQIESEHGVRIRLNCYTSALDSKTRKSLERDLGALLRRKTDDWVFLDEIRALEDNPNNTVFILATTPVIEVGRDYDLDWCILDPSSDMSIIQSAGRILRHRTLSLPAMPNVALINGSVRSLLQEGSTGKPYGYPGPGFQQKDPLKGSSWAVPWKALDQMSAAEIFGADMYAKGIHAGNRLTQPITPADKMDRETIRHVHSGHLSHGESRNHLKAFLETENPWRDGFFDDIKFRATDEDGSRFDMRYLDGRGWLDISGHHEHAVPIEHEEVGVTDEVLLFKYQLLDGTTIQVRFDDMDRLRFSKHLGLIH